MGVIDLDHIPDELKTLPQWVVWRYETREGKQIKVPYRLDGQHAKSNDPATWADFESCVKAASRFDGIGIMFANGLVGVDLDHHVDEHGQLSDLARVVVERLPTYWEYSPSGTGLHALCFGKLPDGPRKHTQQRIEMYAVGRFFTMTGHHLEGTPTTIANLNGALAGLHRWVFAKQETPQPTPTLAATQPLDIPDLDLLEMMCNAKNGGTFQALWRGDTSVYSGDESSADLALCNLLAFWTQKDAARIDRLFRQSSLIRPKWDQKHFADGRTYGQATIEKAIANTSKVYDPGRHNGQHADILNDDNIPAVPMPDLPNDYAPIVDPRDEWRAQQQTQPPMRRYTLHTAAEALEPQPPIEWVIDRLFSAGSVSILVGEPGSKKTYALLDAAVCVAHGIRWLDFDTRESPVLFIDEESGKRRMNRRLSEVLRGHMAGADTPIFFTTLERFQLASKTDELAIESAIEESGARFVIIDALADVMPGGDENAVKDVQPIFIALRSIAERTQSAIVLIHHINKIGTYRGSSAIKGAVDLLLVAQSKPDDPTIEFSFDKARDVEPFKFAARAIFDCDQVYLSSAELKKAERKLSKSQAYIMRYLESHGDSLLTDITGHADQCSSNGARQAVYALVQLGMVQRVDAGGAGVKAIYGLVQPSQAD